MLKGRLMASVCALGLLAAAPAFAQGTTGSDKGMGAPAATSAQQNPTGATNNAGKPMTGMNNAGNAQAGTNSTAGTATTGMSNAGNSTGDMNSTNAKRSA